MTRFQQIRTLAGKGSRSDHFTQSLRGLAIGAGDRLYAAGDSEVKVFDSGGGLLERWKTGRPGYCVATDGVATDGVATDGVATDGVATDGVATDGVAIAGDDVWVGETCKVEVFSPAGELRDTWHDCERLGLVTAIGFAGDDVLVADAKARCIRRFNRQGGFLNNIGDQHRKGGFHIPNGVVDFAVDGEGIVHVANPGMHRVERYTPAGELLGHFGRFDHLNPEGFPGCCNPTNLALAEDGKVVVTEKAGPRAKVYDAEGGFLEVIAGGETFDASCKNMDVAIDSAGRIYVADTIRLSISVFEAVAEPVLVTAGEEV